MTDIATPETVVLPDPRPRAQRGDGTRIAPCLAATVTGRPDILDDLARRDPEQAVLVAAIRGEPLPPTGDEVRLAALANWHRVEGLLARMLVEQQRGSDELQAHFRDRRTATQVRWGSLRARLVDLLAAWTGAGIQATLLKGAALVESGLLPAAERPMADLDVLIDRDDAIRAHSIARGLGFTSASDAGTWHYATTRHHQLPTLVDPTTGVIVEVHHRLLDVDHAQSRLDAEARRATTPLEGIGARRLDHAGSWLHLAAHFWDDRRRGTGGPLLQLRDLDTVLQHLDLGTLRAAARRAGSERLVGVVAAVVAHVTGSGRATDLAGRQAHDIRVDHFVASRVLGRRSPLAQLVHPTTNVDYTPWRLATRLRRQLWPPIDEIRRTQGSHARHRDHVVALMPVLRDGIQDRRTTAFDVGLDMWAHEIIRKVRT